MFSFFFFYPNLPTLVYFMWRPVENTSSEYKLRQFSTLSVQRTKKIQADVLAEECFHIVDLGIEI